MGTFYICPTPIGNLEDISKRLVNTLSKVDVVYAEDTRVAKKLLSHLNLKKDVKSYFKGNEIKKISEISNFLNDNKSVALISDAGTPLISDPGNMLIKKLVEDNFEIISIPGPSSVLVALTLSGFEIDQFTFLGFIPKSGKERSSFYNLISQASHPLVCFTSPNRLKNDLEEFINKDLENEIVVCRELTKKFESIYRGTARDLLNDIPENKYKGEVTLVIGKSNLISNLDIDIENFAKKLIEFQVPKREIAKIISSLNKVKVNKIYDLIKNL
jgi:16S rRNA (cytidine1402-2'-O)-methyltransferase